MSARPRKRFAQHWLRSEKVLNSILEAAQLKKSDRVLEIGPGTGILTRRLLAEVQSVVAVEIDRDLCHQ
ncbi:MAG: rRNA adenine N-6-methyltransferase family protein, partial [Brasilonema sp.]